MASELQSQSTDLILAIIARAKEFNFFQLLQWLELRALNYKKFLVASHSLAFPATDILSGRVDSQQNIIVELSFMGLHGVDSSLPHYFIMLAAGHDEKATLMRDFLAIFNQRFYELYYFAWRKCKVLASVCQKPASAFQNYLLALAGFSFIPSDGFIPAFCGVFGMRIHNTIGLSGIISKYLQTNTSIKSFVPQWLNQETTVYLGKNTCLGDNIILGDKILDASSKIIITIGPIDLIKGYTLLPKQPAAKKLHRLLQSYLPAVITYDICLTIITATKDFILGSQYGLLGFVSWLGQMKENYYNVQFSRSAVES